MNTMEAAPVTPIKTSSTTSLPSITSASDLPKEGSFGAAFSLASLQQGDGGSRNNISMLFDTGMFLKSGSFDQLQLVLGSQVFKQSDTPAALDAVKNLTTTMQPIPTPQVPAGAIPLPAETGSPVSIKSMVPSTPMIPSNVITAIQPAQINMNLQQIQQYPAFGNNALIQPKETDKRIVEKREDNSKFVDVTPFLTLPQHEAAKKLGIPSSTLAKRWKEASCNRKWPYRTVSKLDKEILTLLKNVENAKTELSPSVEATLGFLLKKRQEELKTVLVRL